MANETVEEFYDKQYRSHREHTSVCHNSLHDMQKATRRMNGALRSFGITINRSTTEVLDVGCGLGYYTKALAETGAIVTGLDFSAAGIEVAKLAFPCCNFQRGAWPDDIERVPKYDLIWCINFSLINTFDIPAINRDFVAEAMARLKPGGWVIVGWNTDFSGRKINGYCNWSLPVLREMRKICGLSRPRVAEAGSVLIGNVMICAGLLLRKSVPIFMARQKIT